MGVRPPEGERPVLNRGDYEEKRDHRRMDVDCPMTFQVVGSGEVQQGLARDLSATGMLIACGVEIAPGTRLEVKVSPPKAIVPPLDAVVEVVRCRASEPGRFELGVTICEFRS